MTESKLRKPRPWLTSTGVEIPTLELRQIAKSWDLETWAEYLDWFDVGRREALVRPFVYDLCGNNTANSVFDDFFASNRVASDKCEHLLSLIPENESEVLRLIFFHGKTIREVAAIRGISKSGAHKIKNRAISRLKALTSGDGVDAARFMRGVCDEHRDVPDSLWRKPTTFTFKEAHLYHPKNQDQEFAQIPNSAFRVAINEMTPLSRSILYLRFWCELSQAETARHLRTAANFVQEIEQSAVSNFKRLFFEIETGRRLGGSNDLAQVTRKPRRRVQDNAGNVQGQLRVICGEYEGTLESYRANDTPESTSEIHHLQNTPNRDTE